MNVRLGAGEVRVRVARGEAEALARGEPLPVEGARTTSLAFEIDLHSGRKRHGGSAP